MELCVASALASEPPLSFQNADAAITDNINTTIAIVGLLSPTVVCSSFAMPLLLLNN
jgi:hypothetical protein